jgi:hypothetical protein
MQGDIFQLEHILSHDIQEAKAEPIVPDTLPHNEHSPSTAYNDTTAVRETSISPLDTQLGLKHGYDPYPDMSASLSSDCSSPLSPCFSDECAILTDDEDDMVTPRGPEAESHHSTTAPVKQAIIGGRSRGSDTRSHARRLAVSKGGEDRKPVVAESTHVSAISGPLMSWWPAPIEHQVYEWNEKFYE